jgi:catechol 2,3-dioxygenase-like lactoylglutathione lyase family enzyme
MRLRVLITHLALTVRDPDRSRRFYLETLGLDGIAEPQPWGVRVDLRNGFMLALMRGEPMSGEKTAVHFGCSLPDGATARDLRERLRIQGVPELEWGDSADYVGVKVADPDGYVVEVAYDA